MSAHVEKIRKTPRGKTIGLRIFFENGDGGLIGLTDDEARQLIADLQKELEEH